MVTESELRTDVNYEYYRLSIGVWVPAQFKEKIYQGRDPKFVFDLGNDILVECSNLRYVREVK